MSDLIDLTGLGKATVLAALYNGARAQGAGFINYDPTPMEVNEATWLLKRQTYFDYLKGRAMKVELSGDQLDPRLYDRDNGQGAAQRVINALRSTGLVNPEEVEQQHLDGTLDAARLVDEHIHDKNDYEERGGVLIVHKGLSDLAPYIKPKIDEVLGSEAEDHASADEVDEEHSE